MFPDESDNAERAELPSGVVTMLTKCYSIMCSEGIEPCYSYCCPLRVSIYIQVSLNKSNAYNFLL
jgi:hypothetical protein